MQVVALAVCAVFRPSREGFPCVQAKTLAGLQAYLSKHAEQLPVGSTVDDWTIEQRSRHDGILAGKEYYMFIPPTGRQCKSRAEVLRALTGGQQKRSVQKGMQSWFPDDLLLYFTHFPDADQKLRGAALTLFRADQHTEEAQM